MRAVPKLISSPGALALRVVDTAVAARWNDALKRVVPFTGCRTATYKMLRQTR